VAKESKTIQKPRWTRTTLPRLILVIGAESALRSEALSAVRLSAFGAESGALNQVVMHGPAGNNEASTLTPADILDEVCTSSMFASDDEAKVVIVRQADVFLTDKEWREVFERGAQRIPPNATLVLEAATYGQLKSTRIYKTLASAGAVIECESLVGRFGDTRELQDEVDKRARARGLQLSHGALLALVNRSAKSLGIIDEELGKIALALAPEPSAAKGPIAVTEQDIGELCAQTSTYSGFAFVDAVIDKDARKALEVLGGIFDRGIADSNKPGKIIIAETSITMLLLGALTWKLSQLQDVQAGIDSGKGERDAFVAAKVMAPFMQDQMRRTLKKHSGPSLRRAVDALFRANLDLRLGGRQPQEVLEQLVWKIVR